MYSSDSVGLIWLQSDMYLDQGHDLLQYTSEQNLIINVA